MHATQVPIHATHAGAPLGSGEAIAIGLAALAITLLAWAPVEHLDTMSHEGAHALLAILLGFTVTSVILDRNASGLTRYAGRGLRVILVGIAGYLGPSLFGVAAAKLISLGYPTGVLWLTVVLLVMLLTVVGTSFGLVSVPIAIGLLTVILRYAGSGTEVVLAYGLTWLLLLSGVRTAFVHGAGAGDAHILRGKTHLPRELWALIWMGGTVAALLYGGELLVMR